MAVVYDLKKSPYVSEYRGLKFYFSSDFYKKKFDESVESYVENESIKFSAKYKIPLEFCKFYDLFSISLYNRIEKRGSRILWVDGREYKFNISIGGLEHEFNPLG